jgi:hypothetical protein
LQKGRHLFVDVAALKAEAMFLISRP